MKFSENSKKNTIVITIIMCVCSLVGAVLSINNNISEKLKTAENEYQVSVNQANDYADEQRTLIKDCFVFFYFNETKKALAGYEIVLKDYFKYYDAEEYHQELWEYNSVLGFVDNYELIHGVTKDGNDLLILQLTNEHTEEIHDAICKECEASIQEADQMIADSKLANACSASQSTQIELYNEILLAKVELESTKQSKWNPFYYSLTIGLICSSVFYFWRSHKKWL